MVYFIFFLSILGLFIAAAVSRSNTQQWHTKMMLITSIIMLGCYIILGIAVLGRDSYLLPSAMLIVILICFLLYLIALLFYCAKTYAATKANEQLDYLNFQLKDQLKIRSQEKNSEPQIDTTNQTI